MMNLHDIAGPVIAAINPFISATFNQNTGYTTSAAGKRTPTYATSTVSIQVQGIGEKELAHLNGMNIDGILRKVYADGAVSNVVRAKGKGGDNFVFNGALWLVVHVEEQWPDWCSVVVQQQLDEVV